LDWKWDYVVFQKPYFREEVYAIYPSILEKLEPIATNETLILCKRKTDTISQSLMTFLGVKKAYKTIKQNFNKELKGQNFVIQSDSTNHLGLITEENVYGFSQDFTSQVGPDIKPRILKFKAKFLRENDNPVTIIVAYSKGNELSYYQGIDLNAISKKNEWFEKEGLIFLPQRKSKDEKLSFYIYNPAKNRILMDDFEFQFFKN
jgi:hypothetical protein